MCCGSRRAALRQSATFERATMPAAPAEGSGEVTTKLPYPAVNLRYLAASSIRLRGPVTGWPYDFSAAAPTLPVEARDAALLLRGGQFRRA